TTRSTRMWLPTGTGISSMEVDSRPKEFLAASLFCPILEKSAARIFLWQNSAPRSNLCDREPIHRLALFQRVNPHKNWTSKNQTQRLDNAPDQKPPKAGHSPPSAWY